ncbi:cyclic nucleotide-binding domain-containing protein [Rariglobus hedericola]|uniref:Cyclic nucleotide-binding domain-containing protein n=1 Tax=Rariglobus hedericola TaxID=2597822 RepID=A0A556QMX8_9BACT|nr:cyclic nucleotide-binding domain-containing protein [Rariglobus hedericola]TSJ77952.1 cyclic nucleotide-binding domain-containing protein [Rariglobus hedericola]
MDQNLLLTVEKLTLNPDIQRGWVANRAFVIKNVPAQTYLSVSAAQAVVLQVFSEGSTVPAALAHLLKSRECLPLREFYELVLKAHHAGILCAGSVRKPVKKTIRWPGLKANFIKWPVALLSLVVVVWMAVRSPSFSLEWGPLVAGVLLALGMLVAGQLLAAAVLVNAGGDVYAGRRLAGVHCYFDLRDTRLMRPDEQLLITLAGSLPLTAALLVALCKFPLMALPLAAVWLLVWRPWGQGLPRRLAGLLSRYPDLDTDSRFMFLPNQRPQLHWRPWWQLWDWRVCAIELVCAAGWALLVARLVLDGLGLSFMEVATDWSYWSWSLPALGSALLITVMVIMIRRWRDGLRQSWRGTRQRWATTWRHWRHEYVFPDNEAALLRLAAAHPLLGQLNPYDQALVCRSWRPVTFKAWTDLASDQVESNHVGLILSGRAQASRVGKNGRRLQALSLEEGDFFGLPHLKPGGMDVLLHVRSRTPLSAMMMPVEVFKSVILERLGAEVVYDLTHKYAFLRMLSLCKFWHTHAVARFARLAQVAAYSDGNPVVYEKSEMRWFYIVYDGIAQVRSREKLLTRLKSGDFFGEISLLQNSSAMADVVAQGQLRCLQIDRTSFLRFMTHNHHVALRLEKISSYRLGHPILPLGLGTFDPTGHG